jgi:hypothetical protein
MTVDVCNSLAGFAKDRIANDTTTHTLLSNMSESITPTVRRTEQGMALIHARVQEQAAVVSSNHALLRDMSLMMKEMQLNSRNGQRLYEDQLSDSLRPGYRQNSKAEGGPCGSLAGIKCTCTSSTNEPAYRRRRQIHQSWGGFAVSMQEDVQAQHHPGCIFYTPPTRSWKSTLTYYGLRSLFSHMINISLVQNDPVGAYSLSFGLQSCNVVASSPAFDIFARDTDTGSSMMERNFKSFGVEETTRMVIEQLRRIYSSGDASPFDVDQDGNNIAFLCLKVSHPIICQLHSY